MEIVPPGIMLALKVFEMAALQELWCRDLEAEGALQGAVENSKT